VTDEQAKSETGEAPTSAVDNATTQAQQQPRSGPVVAASAPRTRPWLLWIVVILLCCALGAFYWQQTRFSLNQSAAVQSLQENNQQLTAALRTAEANMQIELQAQAGLLQSSADSLQQALSGLQTMEQQDEQRVQGLQQRMERQLQDTRTVVTALQRQVAGLQQRDTRWLNAEASYLMRMAEHKLIVENNAQAALQLLQVVNGLLRDQLDPLAQTAQQSVLQDIAALESAQVPDRLLLAQRVSELAGILETVSVSGARQAMYQQALGDAREQTSLVAQNQSWTAAVMNLFRSIFVWRQTEQNPLEFLPPDQESLLKLQLRLQFEQARLAVVQADQRLFEDALQQVAAGLQRYFMQESAVATRLHDDVQALAAQGVRGDLPDISATRALVEQLQGAEPEPLTQPFAAPQPSEPQGAEQ
jgi:uroporphyrin-3 C-methyltransferase